MIKHIVMWKLHAEAEGKSRVENAQLMKAKLEALPAKIPDLLSAEVGIHMFEERNDAICDVVLTATCENEEALTIYAQHPEHVKVVDFIKKVVNERRVVDYWID